LPLIPAPPRRGCRSLHRYPIAPAAERPRAGGRHERPRPPRRPTLHSMPAAGLPCWPQAIHATEAFTRSAPTCTPHPLRRAEGVVPSTATRSHLSRSGQREEAGGNACDLRKLPASFRGFAYRLMRGKASMLWGSPDPLFLGGDRLALAAWQGWGEHGLDSLVAGRRRGRGGRESVPPVVPGRGFRWARMGGRFPRGPDDEDTRQSGSLHYGFRLPDLSPSILGSGLPKQRQSAGN
jgi:hypothetical protein